jgi:hypothetical protein
MWYGHRRIQIQQPAFRGDSDAVRRSLHECFVELPVFDLDRLQLVYSSAWRLALHRAETRRRRNRPSSERRHLQTPGWWRSTSDHAAAGAGFDGAARHTTWLTGASGEFGSRIGFEIGQRLRRELSRSTTASRRLRSVIAQDRGATRANVELRG